MNRVRDALMLGTDTPQVWLESIADAKHRDRGWVGGGLPGWGFRCGYSSVAIVGHGFVLLACAVPFFEGFGTRALWLSASLVLSWWAAGWPFWVWIGRKGVLTSRGYIRFTSVVAAGWAHAGSRGFLWHSSAPVLIVRRRNGRLAWRALPQLRRDWARSEERRLQLLNDLVGGRLVPLVPMPEEAVPKLAHPF